MGGDVTLAACWAHARREFYGVHQDTGSPNLRVIVVGDATFTTEADKCIAIFRGLGPPVALFRLRLADRLSFMLGRRLAGLGFHLLSPVTRLTCAAFAHGKLLRDAEKFKSSFQLSISLFYYHEKRRNLMKPHEVFI